MIKKVQWNSESLAWRIHASISADQILPGLPDRRPFFYARIKRFYPAGAIYFMYVCATRIMKYLHRILLFLALLSAAPVIAQSDNKGAKNQKQAEKKKQEQVKKQRKAEEIGRKRHEKIQSKDVKKRWKKNKNKYKHVDTFDKRAKWRKKLWPRKRPSNK